MDTNYSLPLYTKLFAKTVQTSDEFVNQITRPEHQFYGAARDIAREILSKTEGGKWKYIASRIDDIGVIVERATARKIQKWYWKAVLGNGKMPLDSPQSTIKWLFERMVSEYKNLFDPNRKNYLDLKRADKILKFEALNKLELSLGEAA